MDSLTNQVKAGPQGIDPASTASYINKSVATPLLRQYDQSIMPRINDSFASVGALMSSRRGFAGQQALEGIQNTIGQQLASAQLSNQQLNANLQLGYGQLGAGLTGQPHMAIQPYRSVSMNGGPGMNGFGSNGFSLNMQPVQRSWNSGGQQMPQNQMMSQQQQGLYDPQMSDSQTLMNYANQPPQNPQDISGYLDALLGGSGNQLNSTRGPFGSAQQMF